MNISERSTRELKKKTNKQTNKKLGSFLGFNWIELEFILGRFHFPSLLGRFATFFGGNNQHQPDCSRPIIWILFYFYFFFHRGLQTMSHHVGKGKGFFGFDSHSTFWTPQWRPESVGGWWFFFFIFLFSFPFFCCWLFLPLAAFCASIAVVSRRCLLRPTRLLSANQKRRRFPTFLGRIDSVFTGFYRILPGFTEFREALPAWTSSLWFFMGFTRFS